jgi:hypothetical protein
LYEYHSLVYLYDIFQVYTSYQVNDSNLTLDQFVYHNPDILASSLKEWHENKTGILTKFPFGPFALKRIDKTIQDPVWEAAKSLHEGDYDPIGQLPNQPHIELWTTELYFGPPRPQDNGESIPSLQFSFIDFFSGTFTQSGNW